MKNIAIHLVLTKQLYIMINKVNMIWLFVSDKGQIRIKLELAEPVPAYVEVEDSYVSGESNEVFIQQADLVDLLKVVNKRAAALYILRDVEGRLALIQDLLLDKRVEILCENVVAGEIRQGWNDEEIVVQHDSVWHKITKIY